MLYHAAPYYLKVENMKAFIILSFVGVIISSFSAVDFVNAKYLVVVCAALGLVFYCVELMMRQKRSNHYTQQESTLTTHAAEANCGLSEENRRLAEELSLNKKYIQEQQESIDKLGEKCVCVSNGSDITQKLTQIVQEKTEESTLEFTHRVYEVLELSEQLNRAIQQVVGSLSSEQEGSLSQDVLLLEQEQNKIESLINDFTDIRAGYSTEVEKIKEDLSSIGEFVGVISDLADRTNILAINASIEAARAGRAGDGFAVIGTEIQRLSQNSKEIAEQINSTIQSSVSSVSDSVEHYNSTINSAVNRLEQSGHTYATLVKKLNPQIEELSKIVGTSDQLSSQIHENVDEITVHLQYQDRIKQILSHLLQILRDIGEEAKETVKARGWVQQIAEKELYTDMVEKASKHFTCEEEYNAFGLNTDTNVKGDDDIEQEGSKAKEFQAEFADNVELF